MVEYFDSGGDAVEQLYWSTATMAKVIIPAGPLQPPYHAAAIYPSDEAVDVPQQLTLSWGAGEKAAKHDVYFGDRCPGAVADATPATAAIYKGQQKLAENTFDPGILEWNKTYYWRIDEVNDAAADSPWKGTCGASRRPTSSWSTTWKPTRTTKATRSTSVWIDGFTDGKSNGSTVGNMEAPFAEQVIVHGGRQSMPMAYDNSQDARSSARPSGSSRRSRTGRSTASTT